MRLDERIIEGSRVLVGRRFEAEVISIASDRLTCQVHPIPKVVPPPYQGEDGEVEEAEPSYPPLLVPWNEVKLPDQHL